MEIKAENDFYSIQQTLIYKIVKAEDEALIEALKEYAKENSVELRLLDEKKVKQIIKKGLMIYHAEEHEIYSHSYIRKSKIEDKIEELEKMKSKTFGINNTIVKSQIETLQDLLKE